MSEESDRDTTPNWTRANLVEPVGGTLDIFAQALCDRIRDTVDTPLKGSYKHIKACTLAIILDAVDYHSVSPIERACKPVVIKRRGADFLAASAMGTIASIDEVVTSGAVSPQVMLDLQKHVTSLQGALTGALKARNKQ